MGAFQYHIRRLCIRSCIGWRPRNWVIKVIRIEIRPTPHLGNIGWTCACLPRGSNQPRVSRRWEMIDNETYILRFSAKKASVWQGWIILTTLPSGALLMYRRKIWLFVCMILDHRDANTPTPSTFTQTQHSTHTQHTHTHTNYLGTRKGKVSSRLHALYCWYLHGSVLILQ